MKKLALTFTVLSAACAFTFAGAPESYKQQQQVEIPPPCAQFGGFDVSVNVGGAFESTTWNDNDDWIDNFDTDFNTSNPSRDRTGVTTGGSVGWTWQKNCTVFGLVVDGNWASIDGTTHATPVSDGDTGTFLSIHDQLDFWGTARTRTGIVVDNLLLYLTGGFAFANIDHKWTVNDTDRNEHESFSADSFRWGGVVGAGTEWAINRAWSLRTEFLYCYFTEEHTSDFSPAADQTVHFKSQDSMLVSRIALVYRFGPGK